jgi:hypothetical protein
MVIIGNRIKNKLLYENSVQLEAEEDGNSGEKLLNSNDNSNIKKIVFPMKTEAFFSGLPLVYDEDLPSELNQPEIAMLQKDFLYTIMNVNYIIQKNIPCVGKIVIFSIMGIVTCGATWLPLWHAGTNATEKLEQFLQKQNESVYDVKYGKGNVTWQLHKQLQGDRAPCSWIEVHIQIDNIKQK